MLNKKDMTNEEKANELIAGDESINISTVRFLIKEKTLQMTEWKDEQMKKTLIDFMHYLDRRDFFHDDLCFDIEHQVETFIELRNREEQAK